MKAFIAGAAAVLVIALVASFTLDSLNWSSGAVYTSPNVRQ